MDKPALFLYPKSKSRISNNNNQWPRKATAIKCFVLGVFVHLSRNSRKVEATWFHIVAGRDGFSQITKV